MTARLIPCAVVVMVFGRTRNPDLVREKDTWCLQRGFDGKLDPEVLDLGTLDLGMLDLGVLDHRILDSGAPSQAFAAY